MIVIINGPCGVGKTEVSWKLLELFEQAVMLDGDFLGAVHPFQIYDEERVAYLYRTLCELVAFHQRKGGYADFVVNYVFETPESLADLRRQLGELDDVTYAYRLTATDNEMVRRIRQRNTEQAAWELTRFRELTDIIGRGALRGDMGYPIDTTGRNAVETAAAIWANIHEAVEIMPYDPSWPAAFAAEQVLIERELGGLGLGVHHVGSTAVPGLPAKPIIDILVEVRRLADATRCIPPLLSLGYHFLDYPQNRDRRFFRKGEPRSHHLHIVERGSRSAVEHLAFRDALRASAAWRDEYAALKLGLAARFKEDRATYSEQKGALVARVVREWMARSAGG